MFEKYTKYFVFKIKDVDKYLSVREQHQLLDIQRKIDVCREYEGKAPLDTVVVESSYRCFKETWDLIEKEFYADQIADSEITNAS